MGENKREVEFDELEKLLGEIPNATSGYPHFEEFGGSKVVALDGRDLSVMASAFGQLSISNGLANGLTPSNGFHSPQLDHPQAVWRNLDQEHYYRLCQQNPVANFASRMVNQNGMPYLYEMPISQGVQQSEQGQFFRSYGFPRCFKQLDRTSQQIFSEKNLVRGANGVGSLRSVKFGAANESLNNVNQNVKATSNVHLSCSMWGLPHGGDTCLRSCNRTLLMAKDQHGCRLLQRRISEGGIQEVEKIFVDIIDHIVELATDSFGNYLVQKLLEVCDEDQQTQILKVITRNSGHLVRISCDMHGTRVVQKVIETLKTPEQTSLVVNSLKPCIVILMKNTNGNHVAQRCLQHLTPQYIKFLFDAAAAYCVELATDRHGCCVLQKCLNYCGGKERRCLIHEISLNALILSQDPYGNYVVQFIFDLDMPQAKMNIFNQLKGKFPDLSMQKFSSNVVEKCLEHSGEEHRGRIIQELIDSPKLDQIMQDPYGNYVIQAALKRTKGATKSALVEAIEVHGPVLRTSPYGKKVLSCNSLKNNL